MNRQNNTTPLPSSRTMEDVAHFIKKMKFRKKLFGGVDEADVWRQMEALHREYEAVFLAQRIRFEEALKQKGITAAPAPDTDYHGGKRIRPSAGNTRDTGTDIMSAGHPLPERGASDERR